MPWRAAVAAEAAPAYAAAPSAAESADVEIDEADALLDGIEAGLERLAALPLDEGSVAAERLVATVDRLARVERKVVAEQHRRVAAVDARAAHTAVGARTTATMLANRLGLTRSEARARAETAVALADLPETAARLAAGDLAPGHAETTARGLRDLALRTADQPTAETEAAIAELDRLAATEGARLDRRALRERLDAWADRRDPGSLADREKRAWRRRRAWLSAPQGPDRMARLTADLPPVQAATVRAALDALLRKETADDPRDPQQRCADALVELAQRALDSGDLPEVAAQRPHVVLIATAGALHDHPDAPPPRLDGHGPVSSATARQICCDADTTTVTTSRNGDVLDAGRRHRDPTTRQRAAVIARDQQCIGCGAPVTRCQVHHVWWWTNGGPTDLDNLCLLCWDCHHHVHHYDWDVTRRADGTHTLTRPGPTRPRPGPRRHRR